MTSSLCRRVNRELVRLVCVRRGARLDGMRIAEIVNEDDGVEVTAYIIAASLEPLDDDDARMKLADVKPWDWKPRSVDMSPRPVDGEDDDE